MASGLGSLIGLAAAFVIGFGVSHFMQPDGSKEKEASTAEAEKSAERPVYMIVGGVKMLQPDEAIKPYADAAGPLARAAGIQVLGRTAKPILMEGEWPNEGAVIIESFPSKQAMMDFWYSDGYQEAKKLREGVVDIDFIIAVEAPEPEQPAK